MMNCLLETIVIEDNNPNLLAGAVVILAVSFIVFKMLEIASNNKRKKRLLKLRKKIDDRHGMIEMENERRKRIANKVFKNSNNM